MFYAPVLFNILGFKNEASLYSVVITGAVNVLSTILSIYSVDKVGRRMLLLEAGVQMFLSQVVIAIIFGIKVSDHSDNLSKGYVILVVIMVCTFVSSFAWSWGPLGWLIPSETFPLETRSAAQSVTVCVNFLFTFIIGQSFLSMLCRFKFGIFLFFSAWVLVMSFFVFFLLPETKNTPIEEMIDITGRPYYRGSCSSSTDRVQRHELEELKNSSDQLREELANIKRAVEHNNQMIKQLMESKTLQSMSNTRDQGDDEGS